MAKDELWHFIQKMQSTERRYFSRNYIQLESQQAVPIYIRLFEMLCKQKSYCEDQILQQLGPALNKGNISYVKNYLFEQLSTALIRLEEETDQDAYIFKQLSLIRLLRKKGLYAQAIKVWHKAITKARAIEQFPLILQLKEEYRKLQLYNNPRIKHQELISIYYDSILEASEHTNLIHLEELTFQAILMRKKSHFKFGNDQLTQLEELLANPVLGQEPKNDSFWFHHYYNMCKATLHYLKRDKNAYQWAFRNINRWLKSPTYINNNPDNYLEVLYIFYYTAILAKDLSKIEYVMNHKSNSCFKTESHRAYFEVTKSLALNRVYNRTGQYKKVSELLIFMEKQLNTWCKYVNLELQRTLYMSMGVANFALEKYAEAFSKIKQGTLLLNDETRPEQVQFSQLFLLLICYENKDPYHFEIQYKTTYNYFHKKRNTKSFEHLIVEGIYKLFYTQNTIQRKPILQHLHEQITANKSDPVQQQIFNFFNFGGWVQSKLEGISYRQWVIQNTILSTTQNSLESNFKKG